MAGEGIELDGSGNSLVFRFQNLEIPDLLLFCLDWKLVPTLLCEWTKPPVGCVALCVFLMGLPLIALGSSGLQGGQALAGEGNMARSEEALLITVGLLALGLVFHLGPLILKETEVSDVQNVYEGWRKLLEKNAGPSHQKDRKMAGG